MVLISGFVIDKKININEMLLFEENEFLFLIVNINEIWVVVYVNESNILNIWENYDVQVKMLVFFDKVYFGKIEKIYNVIDVNIKFMKFCVCILNQDYQLKLDMNCIVSVYYFENECMIVIFFFVVIFDKSKYWVMVYYNWCNIEM